MSWSKPRPFSIAAEHGSLSLIVPQHFFLRHFTELPTNQPTNTPAKASHSSSSIGRCPALYNRPKASCSLAKTLNKLNTKTRVHDCNVQKNDSLLVHVVVLSFFLSVRPLVLVRCACCRTTILPWTKRRSPNSGRSNSYKRAAPVVLSFMTRYLVGVLSTTCRSP